MWKKWKTKLRKTDKGEENYLTYFIFIPVHTSQNENNDYFIVLLIHNVLIRLKQATQNWISLVLDVACGHYAHIPFLSKHLIHLFLPMIDLKLFKHFLLCNLVNLCSFFCGVNKPFKLLEHTPKLAVLDIITFLEISLRRIIFIV